MSDVPTGCTYFIISTPENTNPTTKMIIQINSHQIGTVLSQDFNPDQEV